MQPLGRAARMLCGTVAGVGASGAFAVVVDGESYHCRSSQRLRDCAVPIERGDMVKILVGSTGAAIVYRFPPGEAPAAPLPPVDLPDGRVRAGAKREATRRPDAPAAPVDHAASLRLPCLRLTAEERARNEAEARALRRRPFRDDVA